GTIIEMGGGQPLSVEFVHEKAFFDQQIKHGFYTAESLADHGFHDDKGYDAYKHGPYSFDYLPKSALHKAILRGNRDASERIEHQTSPRNPNLYGPDGKPISLNSVTQRAIDEAKRLAAIRGTA
ncbi:MAG TPA: hypothetical protein VFM68_03570, partial [Candidatus Saccharimonadales bacterium]|nr:hypothetical protein [Candidatus Saccharimonadales bacterium]